MAGGDLLAAGLAFRALFAILPGLLLTVGLAGWLVDDPALRAELARIVLIAFPPLAGAVGDALDRLVESRGAFSLIGLVGLAWGASSLYGALDEALGRLIPGERFRNVLERRLRGLLAVLLMLAAATSVIVTRSVFALFEGVLLPLGAASGPGGAIVGLAASGAIIVLAVLTIYRTVPTAPPSLRAASLPALVAGAGIALTTDLYALLAPMIVGGLEAFGVLAALFGALIWLGYVSQLLLVGASWARIRRDAEAMATAGPRPAD